MTNKLLKIFVTISFMITAFQLSGCAVPVASTPDDAIPPTPIVDVIPGEIDNPDQYGDPDSFVEPLIAAIDTGDREKIEMWMTDPFFTAEWRSVPLTIAPQAALDQLFENEVNPDQSITLVNDVDLTALLGSLDPLAIPASEAGVVTAVLVRGWGMDGGDEAVLFISRLPDDRIKWHGWLRINGGFSGEGTAGLQFYKNDDFGLSIFLPQDFLIEDISDQEISFFGPIVAGAGHPGLASISVESADGRTAEEAAQQAYAEGKAVMGEAAKLEITRIELGNDPAFVVSGLAGQDLNRQLFVVHADRLYRILFAPDEPEKQVSFAQMELLYALITNTIQFTD